MKITKSNIISKVRIAIDEILPEGVKSTDTLWEDQDVEIWQAVKVAAEQLSLELPRELLEPVSVEDATVTTSADGEDKYIELTASEYLTLYELKMSDWKRAVINTIEEGSAEALQQMNKWTKGTVWKPKVMEVRYSDKVRLYYWTSTANTVSRLSYIVRPYYGTKEATSDTDYDTLFTSLLPSAESYLIYRTGRLVLTAKKETELATAMDAISKGLPAVNQG